jgi:hypothetical protein
MGLVVGIMEGLPELNPYLKRATRRFGKTETQGGGQLYAKDSRSCSSIQYLELA